MLTKFFFLSLLVGSSISVSFAMKREVVAQNPVIQPRRLVGGLEEFDNLGAGLCSLYALGFRSPDEALKSLDQYAATKHDLAKNETLLCKFKSLNDAIRVLKENPGNVKNWLSPSQVQALAFFALGRKVIFLEARFSVKPSRVGYPVANIEYELGQIAVAQHREPRFSDIVPEFEKIKNIFVGYREKHYTALVDPKDQEQRRIAEAIENMKIKQLQSDAEMARKLQAELAKPAPSLPKGAIEDKITKQLQSDAEMARKLQAELAKPAPSLPAEAASSQPPSFILSEQRRKTYRTIEALCESLEESVRLDPNNTSATKNLQEARDLRESFLAILKRKP